MKRTISILLAVLMLASLCTGAYAAELPFTPYDVLDHMDEGDALARTSEDQAVNGMCCLVDMLSIAAMVRATDEEYEYANACLDRLYDDEAQELSNLQTLALGAIQVFNLLELLAEQEDANMMNEENREALRISFNRGDENAQDAKQQMVNALYNSILMAALIVEEINPSRDVIASVAQELEDFSRDEDACRDVNDQMVNGAYWLQRMLTAMASLLSADEAITDEIMELSEVNTYNANIQTDLEDELAVWLYSCVQMAGYYTEELLAEAA
jgi:hypothetical protein